MERRGGAAVATDDDRWRGDSGGGEGDGDGGGEGGASHSLITSHSRLHGTSRVHATGYALVMLSL